MADDAQRIDSFLDSAGWSNAERTALAGDASSRRYFRVVGQGQSAILMLDDPGNLPAFLSVSDYLSTCGLNPPTIIHQDTFHGMLLLEDFGDALFAKVAADTETEQALYDVAVDVLIALRHCPPMDGLTELTPERAASACAIAFDHYAPETAGKDALLSALETALRDWRCTPTVTALRDFHAENLIWLPRESGVLRAGLLDFQDAVHAPASYDLMSLLTDARREVAPNVRDRCIARYCAASGDNRAALSAEIAVWSVQRNLRILGIFARLAKVGGKPRYLDLMPRVWRHIEEALTHPACVEIVAKFDLPPPGKPAR